MYKKLSIWTLLTLCLVLTITLMLPYKNRGYGTETQKSNGQKVLSGASLIEPTSRSFEQAESREYAAITSYPLFTPARSFNALKKPSVDEVEEKEKSNQPIPPLPSLAGILDEEGEITAFLREQQSSDPIAVPLGTEFNGWTFKEVRSSHEIILNYKDSVRKIGLDWGKIESDNVMPNKTILQHASMTKKQSSKTEQQSKPLLTLKKRLANIESEK